MATLQEALEGAQNGQSFVHRSEKRDEYLSPCIHPGEVRHDVVSKSEWGLGGRADLEVDMILSNPHWSQTDWEQIHSSVQDDINASARDTSNEENYVPSGEIYRRAYEHTGSHELAREALELYPGDYI